MKIEKRKVLDKFRDMTICEWPDCKFCNNRRIRTGLDPAHISARGTGDHKRLDIPCNLVALCRGAHTSQHNSNKPSRMFLFEIAAAREGMDVEEIIDAIHLLRRTEKFTGECGHAHTVKVGRDAFVCIACGEYQCPEKPSTLTPGEFT